MGSSRHQVMLPFLSDEAIASNFLRFVSLGKRKENEGKRERDGPGASRISRCGGPPWPYVVPSIRSSEPGEPGRVTEQCKYLPPGPATETPPHVGMKGG